LRGLVFISVRMLAEMTFADEPFLSGIIAVPKGDPAAVAVALPAPRRPGWPRA
jgi:hypothetical protein